MNIVLVRHVETEANQERMFSGWSDYPITKSGAVQRIRLGKGIARYKGSISRIYSSPLPRTKYTAKHIKKILGAELIYEDALKEMNFGIFEGRTSSDIAENHPEIWKKWNEDFVNFRVPEGESMADVKDRILPFLNEILEAGEDCIIVSHGAAIQAIVTHLLNFDLKDMWRFQIKNGSYTEIEYNDGFSFLKRIVPAD